MTTRRAVVLLPLLLVLACGGPSQTLGPSPSAPFDLPQHIETQPAPDYLVLPSEDDFVTLLAPGISPDDFATQYGLTLLQSNGQYALFTGNIDLSDLEGLAGVEDASTNQEVHVTENLDLTFGFFEGTWSKDEVDGQDAFQILDLPRAHQVATGQGVKVAVLDTGADLTHVYLESVVEALGSEEELTSAETQDGIDEDNDGLIDEAFGHGTHVAGIVHTVAPDATILPIKVLSDDGIGSLWDFLKGLALASQHGANVINLSMKLSPPSSMVEDALERLYEDGIIVVSAAGNDGPRAPAFPAVCPYALGVAALESNGALSSFTGAGGAISLAAPGVAVLSAYPNNEQIYGTGTSMATPIVSGTVALALQKHDMSFQDAIVATCLTAVPLQPAAAAIWGRVVPMGAAIGPKEGGWRLPAP